MRNLRKVKVKGFNGDLNGKDESDEIHHECFLVVGPRENRSTLTRKPLIPPSSTQRFCWYILHSLLYLALLYKLIVIVTTRNLRFAKSARGNLDQQFCVGVLNYTFETGSLQSFVDCII